MPPRPPSAAAAAQSSPSSDLDSYGDDAFDQENYENDLATALWSGVDFDG